MKILVEKIPQPTVGIWILLVLLLWGVNASSQNQGEWVDKIYLTDKSVINGLVIERNSTDSVLLRLNTGDTIRVHRKAIVRIRGSYGPGVKNLWVKTIGVGIGNSYGGFGIRYQQHLRIVKGLAWHVGVGAYKEVYLSNPAIFMNAGVKYFYYKYLYVDLSAGSLQQHARHDGLFITYGTTLMTGLEYYLSHVFAVNLGIGISTKFDPAPVKVDYFTFDAGISFKIPKFNNRDNNLKNNELP